MGNDFYDTSTGLIEQRHTALLIPTQKAAPVRVVRKPKKYRGHKRIRLWRQLVLKRDKYTCVDCGVSVGLQVHHNEHYSKTDISAHEFVSNGITLCYKCHAKRHPELTAGMIRGFGKYTTNPA